MNPTKRLILILLANYCDEKNSCFPSYKHIAKLAGLKDTKHIAGIIKEFEELHDEYFPNWIDKQDWSWSKRMGNCDV